MIGGDAKGRVFTFPIPTYNVTKDFDWDDPKLDYLWEATAKYGIPYFSNFVNSDMDPNDARSMCCRLRLDTRKLEARGGGLFGANPLTGSIGVVTINLPRIGYLSSSEEEFSKGWKWWSTWPKTALRSSVRSWKNTPLAVCIPTPSFTSKISTAALINIGKTTIPPSALSALTKPEKTSWAAVSQPNRDKSFPSRSWTTCVIS